MANVTAMINDKETVAKVADTFKMVYTPFHGCGYKLVPEALRTLGIKHLICVAGADGHRRQLPHRGLPQPGEPGGLLSGHRPGQGERRGLHPGHRPGQRPGGHHGPGPRAASSSPSPATRPACCCWTTSSAPCGAPAKCRRSPVALKTIVTTEMARKVAETNGVTVLRHLHRLQVHGGEEERPGGRRRGQGHLLL